MPIVPSPHRPWIGPLTVARGWRRIAIVLMTAAALAGVSGALIATPVAADGASTREWSAPVPPPLLVDQGFDAPAQRWLPGHRGVDLVAPAGSNVTAAADGIVVFAGALAGRGVVSIEHSQFAAGTSSSTLRTTYEPLDADVRPGDRVRRGESIGTLAADGAHCLVACLHWGLRRQDPGAADPVYLDPLAVLVPPKLRLLPHLDRSESDLGARWQMVGPASDRSNDAEDRVAARSSAPRSAAEPSGSKPAPTASRAADSSPRRSQPSWPVAACAAAAVALVICGGGWSRRGSRRAAAAIGRG